MSGAADEDLAAALVYIVDDDLSVRQALSSLLRAVGRRVRTFATAAEFLRHERPDVAACLVLDVRLPDISGLDLQAALAERGDTLPIIFIAGHADVPISVKAMKGGADEFLSKPFLERELLEAIELALERDAANRLEGAEVRAIRRRMETLSRREFEVMRLIVKGLLNKQAGAELGITEMTVKVHRHRAMMKMQAQSLPELVLMVQRVLPTTTR
jgi:FixJ family two-component response regulator